jgi:hypothetical protein
MATGQIAWLSRDSRNPPPPERFGGQARLRRTYGGQNGGQGNLSLLLDDRPAYAKASAFAKALRRDETAQQARSE